MANLGRREICLAEAEISFFEASGNIERRKYF